MTTSPPTPLPRPSASALPINAQAAKCSNRAWKQTGTRSTRPPAHGAHSEGADLIVNSVSAAPGFRIGNVHVMAGVPIIMRAMLEALAPTLMGGRKVMSVTVRAAVGEGYDRRALGALQPNIPTSRWAAIPDGQGPRHDRNWSCARPTPIVWPRPPPKCGPWWPPRMKRRAFCRRRRGMIGLSARFC